MTRRSIAAGGYMYKLLFLSLLMVGAKMSAIEIDNVEYPVVGFGTSPLTGKTCTEAVEKAFKNGYRIFDTATRYGNFESIAKALKKCKREECYIISKVWHDEHAPKDLWSDLNFTLEQLNTSYIDAYFLHWPNSQIPIEKTLATMEEMRQKKKIRHIGLSNVNVNHLKRALEMHIPITWVQVEMNPYFFLINNQ